MKGLWKKFVACAAAAALVLSYPVTSQAAWIDGDTPGDYYNRVVDSYSNIYVPTIMTNFHASSLATLVPISSKAEFDKESGAAASKYSDAMTVAYVGDNVGYGPSARAVLNTALTGVGATNVATISLNLFKYEGSVYKAVDVTTDNLKYIVNIPKSVRSSSRDYAMIRINPDGSYSYLADEDSDPLTLTFETNYYNAYNVYCFAYAPHGAFDAYKTKQTLVTAQGGTTTTTVTQVTTTTTTTTTTTKK